MPIEIKLKTITNVKNLISYIVLIYNIYSNIFQYFDTDDMIYFR